MKSIALFAAVVLVMAGCGGDKTAKSKTSGETDRTFPVETMVAQAASVARTVEVVGDVVPAETVRITTRVAGIVDRVLVREGDVVQAGAVVAEIDASRLQLELQASQARREQAIAQSQVSSVRLANLRRLRTGDASRVSEQELQLAEADWSAAQASVTVATVACERADRDARDARVTSPIAGTIESRLLDAGSPVQVGTAIASVIRVDPLRVRFRMPVDQLGNLVAGATVVVYSNTASASATIAAISTMTDANRQVTLMAECGANSGLRVGDPVRVVVRVRPTSDIAVVPDLAVQPTERGFVVYAVREAADGLHADLRLVTTAGRTGDGRTYIASGIVAGERIVVRGVDALSDGVLLRVAEPAK